MFGALMLRCLSKLGNSLIVITGVLNKFVPEVVVVVLKPLVALSEGIQTGNILRFYIRMTNSYAYGYWVRTGMKPLCALSSRESCIAFSRLSAMLLMTD